MKITKKQAVKANEQLECVECPDIVEVNPIGQCKYQSAIDLIQGAIEALAVIAKDDVVAKDSIANLGVVLFDLKGNC